MSIHDHLILDVSIGLVVQLQNEWDTTYFNVQNMDNMTTDIGHLVEMELKSQAITTRPSPSPARRCRTGCAIG